MADHGAMRWLAMGLIVAAFICVLLFSDAGMVSKGKDWGVTEDGLLEYSLSAPDYSLRPSENTSNSTLYEVKFTSRGEQIEGLLRMPQPEKDRGDQNKSIPGIVLLPGATVTKEREQGLAKYLCGLGYATLTLDQRNLGATNPQADLEMFLQGMEPTEHKMVYDALASAEILRGRPEIDPNLIIYAGESNGGRVAIIACALDAKARKVVAISTCGYGTDAASRVLSDPEMIRFYRSVDPDTYLGKITPRKLVMIHSLNDTVIPYEYAEQTYAKASEPKILHTVGCAKHGYCTEMNAFLEKELRGLIS
jgi:fermentation-respiration switch protein FrsA (DUF1100 family)